MKSSFVETLSDLDTHREKEEEDQVVVVVVDTDTHQLTCPKIVTQLHQHAHLICGLAVTKAVANKSGCCQRDKSKCKVIK